MSSEAESPWALFSRAGNSEGTSCLRRFRIIETPWFGISIHSPEGEDENSDPHDHPWDFISIMLHGGYVEDFWDYAPFAMFLDRDALRAHMPGEARKMEINAAHRISHARPGTRALVLHGRSIGGWGFWTPRGFVPWRRYAGRAGGGPRRTAEEALRREERN